MVESLMMLNMYKCNVLKIIRTEKLESYMFLKSVQHQIIFPSEPSAFRFEASIHLILE